MKTITIVRKWNNPAIEISITNESIALSMKLDDFIQALTDEVAEEVAIELSKSAGNPLTLITAAQLEKRMVSAIEGAGIHAIFVAATERIMEIVKGETAKIV